MNGPGALRAGREVVLPGAFWAPAPNRHLMPFINAARRARVVANTYYARERLPVWQQLGTPAFAGPTDVLLTPDETRRDRVEERVVASGAAFHIAYGIGSRMLRDVIIACGERQVPCFVWSESLQPRARWDPRRIVRDELYRRVLKRVAGAFAVSTRAARDLERLGVPRHAIFPALYPGPDTCFSHHPRSRRIVYCGRLIELKGLDVLTNALLILAREGGCELEFDVIGDGPMRGFDEELRKRKGIRGTHHGSVPSERVPALLSGAAAVVLPTRRREGWGYVVNEAYSVGVPVVVSDVVGAREIVVADRTGAVFGAGDARALARALRRVLSSDEADYPAIRRILMSIRSDAYLEYVRRCISVAVNGGDPPIPPWHSVVAALGGNAEVARWERWRSGEPR